MDGKYIKTAFKAFLILVVLAFIGQAISLGVYWYQRRNFAKRGFNKEEKDRCEQVINSEVTDYTDYSYCQNYLKWFRQNVNP